MPFLGVARSLQRVEAVGEPVEERLGREQLRPGGGELERERQAVEPFAELHDGVRGGDVGPHGLRALAEERHGLVADERREVELGLALDPQRLAARREQPQSGDGGDELGERTGGVGQELLEVVADHVRASFADAGGDRRRIRRRRAEPVGHRRQDELRVPERRERDEDRSSLRVVAEQARELDREARLAGSSRADDREHPRVALVDQRDRVEQLLLAAEERRGRSRELDAPGRSERWELTVAELVEANCAFEVLEPMPADVAERLGVEERRGRRRDEDLVPVRERGDARAAVDVLAHVTLLGYGRRAGVQPHAHADRSRLEPLARRLRGRRRSSRCRERDEERVALRVDLDAAVRGRRLAHDAPVLRERVGVARRPELVQQARRALDVGEEERDRSPAEAHAQQRC